MPSETAAPRSFAAAVCGPLALVREELALELVHLLREWEATRDVETKGRVRQVLADLELVLRASS